MTCIFKNWSKNDILIAPRTLKVNDVRFEVTAAPMKIYDCASWCMGASILEEQEEWAILKF